MLYRLFPFTVLLLGACVAFSQTPQNIILEKSQLAGLDKALACPDQYAGTISFANFNGQSNDIDPDTIFLCQGDMFNVVHNGDADLSGDPNAATTPGITYIWYDCPPTQMGPDLNGVLSDGCIFVGPPAPANGFYVTAGGNFSGNQTFNNPGTLQNTFNGGDPLLLWFAPITIDNFSLKQYEVDPVSGATGPCVNVNTDEAFAVVYLNAVEILNVNNNAGTSGCSGRAQLFGGLPEYDGSFYNVTVTLVGNPSVQGTVTNNNPITDGGFVNFDVPAPGLYEIVVEDGKSCGATIQVNMTGCVNVTQSISSAVAAPGDNVCLDVTVEGGFDVIASMQYSVTFDPAVLLFTGVQNITPLLPSFNQNSFSINTEADTLRTLWFQGVGGTNLPDGTVLFQVCFDIVGPDGACSSVSFSEVGPITDIEIIDENGNELGFNGISGLVCVSNSALQANATQNDVTCPGGMDGGFTVTVTGGVPPYNITWQNALGGPVGGPGVINIDGGSFPASGLSEGLYIITIVDSSPVPITAIEQVDVTGPPMLNLLFSANSGACSGDLGAVSATLILDSVIVNNPTQDYSFLWSNMQTTPTISGILPGNYSLTVTQIATGCTVQGSVFLPQTAALNVIVQIDSATCTGIPDGIITVMVSGGTPNATGNYSILLGPSSVNNTNSSLMAESGNYMLTVTDANGCTYEEDIFLPAIKVLSITPNIMDVDCSGNCNGSISATGTTDGGTPAIPYTFTWSGSNPPPALNQPTVSQLNDLCIGTYTVVMVDTDGCRVDSTFQIIQPSPLIVTIAQVTNESCQPGMDGSITVAVSGGAYPYTYAWDGGVTATDSTATGLSAGLYTLVVTDSEGCFSEIMAQVNAPAPPVIQSVNDDMIDCADGMDGTLTVVPANPNNIIQYTWSSGDLTPTATGLSPGEYTVTITDANSCTAVDTGFVTSPPPLVLDSISLTPPSCVGGSNGEIIVFVSGGTPNYTFEWSTPGAPSFSVFAFAKAGSHSVTVTDANDCAALEIDTFLDEPPFIVETLIAFDSVSCANTGTTCDGTATVSASYSDGSAGVFNFTWINSGETTNNSAISTAVQLCQGPQPVIIADLLCADTFLVNIPAPLPISPGQNIVNVSCNGFADGEITLLPTGGTQPYSIVWGNGTVGPVLANLPAGNFTAVITDAKNCKFTHTVTVIEPDPFILMLNNAQNVNCAGGNDGFFSVFPQGGNPPMSGVTYLWQNNAGQLNSSLSNDLPAGTYSVTAVDSKGCEAELTHTITEPPPIGFIIGDIPAISCFGGNTSITVDSAWGGAGTLWFRVDGGNLKIPIGQFASGFVAGNHTITVFDANDCTATLDINIQQPLDIQVELPSVVDINLGDSLTSLDPIIISSVPIDTFIWSPADQLSCTDCKNPRVTAIDDQLYTLVVIDINGCTGIGTVFVDLDRNRNVYIPNIFSPNGDGINDNFKVFTGPGVSAINFVRIYDRWGDLIHDVDNPVPSPDGTAPWDGSFRGDEMNPAVFLYLIEVEFIDGKVLLYRGDITLIR